jgi:ubiquinone/menaquinone biosynthesis C-methylase UbiE
MSKPKAATRSYAELNPPVEHQDKFATQRCRLACRQLRSCPPKSLLEIGADTGAGAAIIHRFFKDCLITGLDCTDRLEAQNRRGYTAIWAGSVTNLPFDDDCFSAVFALEVIEHLYPAHVEQSLSEIFRVLVLGGTLVLTTPNPLAYRFRWRGQSILSKVHKSQHYPRLLKSRLLAVGFSGVRIMGSGRATRYLGQHFPHLNLYGSYMISARKF